VAETPPPTVAETPPYGGRNATPVSSLSLSSLGFSLILSLTMGGPLIVPRGWRESPDGGPGEQRTIDIKNEDV